MTITTEEINELSKEELEQAFVLILLQCVSERQPYAMTSFDKCIRAGLDYVMTEHTDEHEMIVLGLLKAGASTLPEEVLRGIFLASTANMTKEDFMGIVEESREKERLERNKKLN